jgi:hypothetical protein
VSVSVTLSIKEVEGRTHVEENDPRATLAVDGTAARPTCHAQGRRRTRPSRRWRGVRLRPRWLVALNWPGFGVLDNKSKTCVCFL